MAEGLFGKVKDFLKKNKVIGMSVGKDDKNLVLERKKPKSVKRKHNMIPENNLFSIKSYNYTIDSHDFSIVPTGIKEFDNLIHDRGLERSSTILISGGAGTGKTTFAIQSIYYSAIQRGEKGIYLSFEEAPEKIKLHMKKNFGWDLGALEEKGLIKVIKVDPVDVARAVEQILLDVKGDLKIDMIKIKLPFLPDRIVVDSLSALSIAFTEVENYRKYIRELFESLEELNCISFVLIETEQDPKVYSRTVVEEFLAVGFI
ncbi:hypothetical protein IIC68_02820, partial [archaeon]|nr:hypothetical protein [archaeon]